jgi:hypothetical protein
MASVYYRLSHNRFKDTLGTKSRATLFPGDEVAAHGAATDIDASPSDQISGVSSYKLTLLTISPLRMA